jgi:polyisoprenoid-binding protein YceI
MSTIETIAPQLVPVGTWQADPVHSQVEFGIKHLGIVTVKGRFGDFDATLEGGDEPRLAGIIRTASVDTYDEDRDAHLRSPEFFDSERYPEARIEARRIESGRILAQVTLKGVTHEVELAARFSGPAQDPFGNERIGLELEGEIDRTDFGLAWNAPLPDSGFVLDDAVKLSASLSFVKEA